MIIKENLTYSLSKTGNTKNKDNSRKNKLKGSDISFLLKKRYRSPKKGLLEEEFLPSKKRKINRPNFPENISNKLNFVDLFQKIRTSKEPIPFSLKGVTLKDEPINNGKRNGTKPLENV